MPQKRVRCTGHGIVNFTAHETTPWEDVWVSWKERPRRRRRAAPTLIGRDSLEYEAQTHRDILATDPQAAREDWYKEELEDYANVIRQFDAGAEIVVGPKRTGQRGGDLSSVFINKPRFDRADAERMLRMYLFERFGLRNVKFSWKRPEAIIIPI